MITPTILLKKYRHLISRKQRLFHLVHGFVRKSPKRPICSSVDQIDPTTTKTKCGDARLPPQEEEKIQTEEATQDEFVVVVYQLAYRLHHERK